MTPGRRWTSSSLGCIVSGLLFHLSVLLALSTLWALIGLPYGRARLRAAQGGWFEQFVSDADLRSRHTVADHSAAALRLDGVTRRLGTFLADRPGDYDGPGPHGDTAGLKELRAFVSSFRKASTDARVAVPAGVAAFVGDHGGDLREIEDLLLDQARVDWKTPGDGHLGPSMLGFRNVAEALLARSLVADGRGDRPGRDRALEAAWQLEQSLARQPDVLHQLIVNAVAGERNACLRLFRATPAQWNGRVRGPERLAALELGYEWEAVTFCRSAERLMGIADVDALEGSALPTVGAGGWLFRVGSAPLVRIAVASYADALRAETARLREMDPCLVGREDHMARLKRAQPFWNAVSREAMPPLVGAWWGGRDSVLDDELTSGVLHERPLLGTPAAGHWTQVSAVCRGLVWRSRAGEHGTMAFTAEGEHEPELDSRAPGLHYAITAP